MRQHRNSESRSPAVVEDWVRRFETACRDRGLRVTGQRRAIYRVLAEETSHPTADSVHARLASDHPSLSIATVYRVLDSLVEAGFVRRVSTTDGAGRFDANVEPHGHLVCSACGRMQDLEPGHAPATLRWAEGTSPAPDRVAEVGGFAVDHVDVRFVGTCPACRRAASTRAAAPTN